MNHDDASMPAGPIDPEQAREVSIQFVSDRNRSLGRNVWLFRHEVYSTEADLTPAEFRALMLEAENKRKAKIARAVALDEQVKSMNEAKQLRKPILDDIKVLVWQRDRGQCVRCGSNRNLEFDHIIPVSMGGANTARNLQLLCEACNRAKGGSLI